MYILRFINTMSSFRNITSLDELRAALEGIERHKQSQDSPVDARSFGLRKDVTNKFIKTERGIATTVAPNIQTPKTIKDLIESVIAHATDGRFGLANTGVRQLRLIGAISEHDYGIIRGALLSNDVPTLTEILQRSTIKLTPVTPMTVLENVTTMTSLVKQVHDGITFTEMDTPYDDATTYGTAASIDDLLTIISDFFSASSEASVNNTTRADTAFTVVDNALRAIVVLLTTGRSILPSEEELVAFIDDVIVFLNEAQHYDANTPFVTIKVKDAPDKIPEEKAKYKVLMDKVRAIALLHKRRGYDITLDYNNVNNSDLSLMFFDVVPVIRPHTVLDPIADQAYLDNIASEDSITKLVKIGIMKHREMMYMLIHANQRASRGLENWFKDSLAEYPIDYKAWKARVLSEVLPGQSIEDISGPYPLITFPVVTDEKKYADSELYPYMVSINEFVEQSTSQPLLLTAPPQGNGLTAVFGEGKLSIVDNVLSYFPTGSDKASFRRSVPDKTFHRVFKGRGRKALTDKSKDLLTQLRLHTNESKFDHLIKPNLKAVQNHVTSGYSDKELTPDVILKLIDEYKVQPSFTVAQSITRGLNLLKDQELLSQEEVDTLELQL